MNFNRLALKWMVAAAMTLAVLPAYAQDTTATAAAPAAAAPAAAAPAAAAPAASSDPAQLTEEGIIQGTMEIDFKTRTTKDTSGDLVEGSAAVGAKDTYKFSFNVAKTTRFAGTITRQPTLKTSVLQRVKQEAQLAFDVVLSVLNPNDLKQKKDVGKWIGVVPINPTSGVYELSGGSKVERPLRISVDQVGKAAPINDSFAGQLLGKAEKKDTLAAYTYNRLVNGKKVSVTVKKSDPMKFQNVVLATGPASSYPRTTVNGRLDYDYETGNWLTDGIKFNYNYNGKQMSDVITGTIKWVEGEDRATTGKGQYEFNLRFNEEANKATTGESAAFESMSDEEAFFAVDNSIPSLTGTIAYEDTIPAGEEEPSASKVTYSLNANKLTKQQVMNFFKLWTLAIGPTNDE